MCIVLIVCTALHCLALALAELRPALSSYHHPHSELNMDKASRVLVKGLPEGIPNTFTALAAYGSQGLNYILWLFSRVSLVA